MQRDRIRLAHAPQHLERAPAIDHEILRDHLDEIDIDLMRQEMLVMRLPQAEPETMLGFDIHVLAS